MIITKTPIRVSLFGGGTDYPVYFEKYGGACLNATIDKYTLIYARWLPPYFPHKYHIVWSRIENVQSIDEIHHPAVRECLRYLNIKDGLVINHDGDVPAASGMGTSSSFTVGLLHALRALNGEKPSKVMLGREAIYVEQQLIKNKVGNQDQLASAIGGLNVFEFNETEHCPPDPEKWWGCQYRKIEISDERRHELEDHLMLFFTGFPHESSQIANTYNFDSGILREMHQMVFEAEGRLYIGKIAEIGKLLHHTWELKKKLSTAISTPYIAFLYDKARNAGAIGGKLLGAGGGGFLLIFCEPDKQESVKEAMKGLLQVPFKFENKGTHIIGNGNAS